jgi:hypothetical protein
MRSPSDGVGAFATITVVGESPLAKPDFKSLPNPNPPAAVIAEAKCSSAIPITESADESSPVPSQPDSDSRTDFNIWPISKASN